MVFDAVDHAPDAYEELDDTELQEEPDAAPAEVESVEIDLAEAEDMTAPKLAPARPAGAMPVLPPGTRGKMKRRRKRTREWWMHIFDDDFMLLAREPSKWGQRREVGQGQRVDQGGEPRHRKLDQADFLPVVMERVGLQVAGDERLGPEPIGQRRQGLGGGDHVMVHITLVLRPETPRESHAATSWDEPA